MTNKALGDVYSEHHALNRGRGFTLLLDERRAVMKANVGTGHKVLDIGCRDGGLTRSFVEGNQVLGVDIDPVALGMAKKQLGIETMIVDLNGDWSELGGRKFDVIVAGEVMEHLYFPHRVSEKVVKHLAPGGKFVGSVPNAFTLKHRIRFLFGSKKNTPIDDPTHINHFHIEELRGILSKHFGSVEIIGLGTYKSLIKISPNLFGFDLFFVCKDPIPN